MTIRRSAASNYYERKSPVKDKALIYPFNRWSKLKKVSDAISKLSWFNEMTSPQGIQLTFRKPGEGWLTAGKIMKASQWLNQFFIMSELFVCQNYPFNTAKGCVQTSVVPLILYVSALLFLDGFAWLVWGVKSCKTKYTNSFSPRSGQKVRQWFGGKMRICRERRRILSCI